MRYKPGDPFVITDPVNFNCAFCEQPCTAGFDQYDRGTVLHKEPICKTFQENDVDVFLELSRKRRES